KKGGQNYRQIDEKLLGKNWQFENEAPIILEYNIKECMFFEKFIVPVRVLYSVYIALYPEFLSKEQCMNTGDKNIRLFK
ncbi:8072_t:CDS:2, partial [Funneliformis geosporum]